MEDNYNGTNITDQATHTISPNNAKIIRVVCNKPVASAVLKIYNGTASGQLLATITLPATLLTEGPQSAEYGISCPNGLTVVTSGASADWTIVWK